MIFAALFAGLAPLVAWVAWLTQTGSIPAPVCHEGVASGHASGTWMSALALAGVIAGGSVWIHARWRGRSVGAVYNAVAIIIFAAMFMHFGGGYPEAHVPLYIMAALLLYYRERWPIALAASVFICHHLGFYSLQEMGVPVLLFSCLDRHPLLIHLFAGIGQFGLLGYLAARMERKDAYLRAAAAHQQLAASVFHNAIEGIVITDAQGIIVSVNPAFTDITGYTAEEALGKTPRLLKSHRHNARFYREMWDAINATGQWKGKIWNRRKSGEVFLESQTIRRLCGEDGVVRYVAVFNDITEQWRKDQRIEHLAFHDSLTGLANRSLLNDRIRQAIALTERLGNNFAVMVLDLDRFKNINDTFGHDQGDALLQVVGARLQVIAREIDTVARLGGDEFVILMQNVGQPSLLASAAERIIESIAKPIELSGITLRVEASLGLSIFPNDGRDPAMLLKNADTAMYEAKAGGKNTYRFFSASMTDKAKRRLHLEMELRQALERGQFELYYQPKVCLRDGQPIGAEALLRWRHPERGMIPPGEFIPLAEETGLIELIGRWVLEEACRHICVWQASGREAVPVAINVSAMQFAKGTLVADIENFLARFGVPGDMLEIELTESTLMSDPDAVVAAMQAIRATGVKIAIDDFGTGYSSLAYLGRLPIDTLKIDRSFVTEAEMSANGRAVCEAIIGLGKSLHLHVVAEGIETDGQTAYLTQQGCYAGQGYHYCRPLPEAEFQLWLARHSARSCASCGEQAGCRRLAVLVDPASLAKVELACN